VAVQELIQQGKAKGKEEGREEGLEKGQLIGQIQLIQRILKRPQTPQESLRLLGTEELETMLAKLETDLARERNDA
jgi:flagellar biosynthesis/type III secretory pathway protein FliH